MQRLPLVLIAALALCAPAGLVSADERSEARMHYDRGTSLFDLGKYRDAAVEYEKAYELRNDPALLFNIGQAYRLASAHQDAIRSYRAYLRRNPSAPNRAEVEARITELQHLIDGEQRATASPPSGVLRPGPEPFEPRPTTPPERPTPAAPATVTPAPAPAPTVSTTPAAIDSAPMVSKDAPAKTPLYKKWWLWAAVGGVVVVGVAVGVAVAATTPNNAPTPPGAYTVSF